MNDGKTLVVRLHSCSTPICIENIPFTQVAQLNADLSTQTNAIRLHVEWKRMRNVIAHRLCFNCQYLCILGDNLHEVADKPIAIFFSRTIELNKCVLLFFHP